MNSLDAVMLNALHQFISAAVNELVKNPEIVTNFVNGIFSSGSHNAVDVAQDALDAYEHGHLTRDQAMRIVEVCLEKDAVEKGKAIDIKSKRVEIENLFNR